MMYRIVSVLVLMVVAVCIAPAWGEGDFTLKIEEKAPPEILEADIREQITSKAYQLSDGDGLFFEIWFVPEFTAKKITGTTKETMDEFEEISLLGAIVVHAEDHHDFRDDPIDPGTYILRMSLQPQDGNHMGTSPFDTFALLMPHDKDFELKDFADHEFMVELASEDTIAEHPPILAMQPMASDEGEFPRLDYEEEEEWHSLSLKFPTKAGSESVVLPIHLVFEGIGDL